MDWTGPHRAHLVGIAGAGMRSLAEVLLARGWRVSGSDAARDVLASLGGAAREPGCSPAGCPRPFDRLFNGHDAAHLADDCELLIHSDAVPADNVELAAARRRGLPVLTYFEALGALTAGQETLAIAGTHGKSTTTAMLGEILVHAGHDPTVFCGASPPGRASGGRSGGGRCAVVEACEYRANFLKLQPRSAAILGIEPDHFDCYRTDGELHAAFARFVELLPPDGLLIARADCPVTRRLARQARRTVETFALATNEVSRTADVLMSADWTAERLVSVEGDYRFTLCRGGQAVADVELRVPGRHNVVNALAAAALAWRYGVGPEAISAGLGRYAGLKRRTERLGEFMGVAVVDDFAHHPTEIAAALHAVREVFPRRRLVCVFQPHQASRTARLLDELAASLRSAEVVAVADIYRAREGPAALGEVTAADLAARIAGPQVLDVHQIEQIAERLGHLLTAGDVLVTLGAGDIRRLVELWRKDW